MKHIDRYKKSTFLGFILVLQLACTAAESPVADHFKKGQTDTLTLSLGRDWTQDSLRFYWIDSALTYTQVKAQLVKEKAKLSLEEQGIDSVGRWFCSRLVYELIPYWYGTPWDFNGYTAVPNQGAIACGYFVSTTLLHMGLNVNRYKMAQQLPIHEAQTLAIGQELKVFEGTTESIIAQMDMVLSDGLYFLGFDQSHVGFLLRENEALFAIHANYIGDGGVAVEPVRQSAAFSWCGRFYIAPITGNELLMKKWLKNEVVTVVEE